MRKFLYSALMCGTASERSRIHRLLQRGQKRQRIALLHRFVAAIHMGRPENTERSVHCVQQRPSVLDLYCFLIITPIYFIINCASSTTLFTYRTKYIQFFIYSIQEFLAIHVNPCYDNKCGSALRGCRFRSTISAKQAGCTLNNPIRLQQAGKRSLIRCILLGRL